MDWWSDKPPLSPLLAVPQPEWGLGKSDDGYHSKQELPMVVGLTGCTPLWVSTKILSTNVYEARDWYFSFITQQTQGKKKWLWQSFFLNPSETDCTIVKVLQEKINDTLIGD